LTRCGPKERRSGSSRSGSSARSRPKTWQQALKGVKRVAVLDKNISLGAKGATALEVKDALYGSVIPVYDYVIGLGGRDVRKKDIREVVAACRAGQGQASYIGLRKEVL